MRKDAQRNYRIEIKDHRVLEHKCVRIAIIDRSFDRYKSKIGRQDRYLFR